MNPATYELARPLLPERAEIPRAGGPPTGAEVKNWPFPQYAQEEQLAEPPVNDGRRRTAPESAEVANWPYPQYS